MMSTRIKRRTYSNSEKEHIFRVCSEAKEKGLEMKTVFIGLADQYDVSRSAIEQMYYSIKKVRENNYISHEQMEMPIKKESLLIEAIETLIRERDFYKSEYEKAMKLLGL